jgi:hypothetical protein
MRAGSAARRHEEIVVRNLTHLTHLTALAIAAGLACPTAALADHIHSDAPDNATGTFCVPPGVYQIEQNAQVDVAAGVPSFSFPSLHRFGIADNFELRLETPILAYTQLGGVARNWVALEGKLNVAKFLPEALPALALFGTARLEPDNSFTPALALLTDIQLPLLTGLNANLGAIFPTAGPRMTYSASVAHRLWGLDWAIYGELAGDYSPASGLGAGLDGGVKYRIGDDTQVMLAAGTDAFKPGDTYFVTTNLSYRFKKY